MIRWLRKLFWSPFAAFCRRFPLWPFKTTLTHPCDNVTCIRIDNPITRFLSRFSGGYDYAVCYLGDDELRAPHIADRYRGPGEN